MSRMKEHLLVARNKTGQEPARCYDNIITVAKTRYANQILTKRIHPIHVISYDRVKHFNLIPQEVLDFDELKILLARAMANPRVCLVRAVPIDDDRTSVVNVKRIATSNSIHGEQTLVPRPSNLVIIDVDNFSEASGDIAKDAWKVLLALNMPYVRCIGIASSSYGVNISDKKGICLRMFFWNESQVTNRDLKRYFAPHAKIVDLSLFQPGQPIYVATPVFVDRIDPVVNRMVEINPHGMCTDIPHSETEAYHSSYAHQYDYYTKADARRLSRSWWQTIATTDYQAKPKGRHDILFEGSCILGKLVGLELITDDEAYDGLMEACDQWGLDNRDAKKDDATIREGLKRGQRETEAF